MLGNEIAFSNLQIRLIDIKYRYISARFKSFYVLKIYSELLNTRIREFDFLNL